MIERYTFCLEANTLGDFLAGAFAPLAFLWLAAAVAIQSQELAAQRKELRLTRAELRLTRDVAKEQVAEARNQARHVAAQTDILTRQQADKTITTMIDGLCEYAWDRLQRPFDIRHADGNNARIPGIASKSDRTDFDLRLFSEKAVITRDRISQTMAKHPDRRVYNRDLSALSQVRISLQEIADEAENCSPERQTYLALNGFSELRTSVDEILEVAEPDPLPLEQ